MKRAPVHNLLLACLRPQDRTLLFPSLRSVSFPKGQTLFAPGQDVRYAFFPAPGTIASLVADVQEDIAAEAAIIGPEGAAGGIVSDGYKPAFARGVIQMGGEGYCLPLNVLARAKKESSTLRDHFARYADCLIAQILQCVACNTIHDFDARLARWLLAVQDRVGADSLHMTQEFVAEMLGVQRTYATRVIMRFVKAGIIHKSRGVITILDRAHLERQSCECYAYLRRHFDRVIPHCYPIYQRPHVTAVPNKTRAKVANRGRSTR